MLGLLAMFKKAESIPRVQNILGCVSQLLQHFEQNIIAEGATKNAGIDAVIELLQSQKD